MRKGFQSTSLLLLAGMLLACESGGQPPSTTTSSTRRDSGTRDSGGPILTVDANIQFNFDAGLGGDDDGGLIFNPNDAQWPDAGPLPDTGPRPDAGPLPDTGPRPDTGSSGGVDCQAAAQMGPYQVQSYTMGLRDGIYGTQTMHYPMGAPGPWPVIAVVPGFVSPELSTQPWGTFMASWGIAAITIGTNTGGELPPERAMMLMDALMTVEVENSRSGSPIMGKIDLTRRAIIGWSMGGGGTLIASSQNPDLKAAITLCAWSPGGTFPDDRVPTLLLASTGDVLAGAQSQGFYDSIPQTTPKMLVERTGAGASHWAANNPLEFEYFARFGISWMKVFLVGDERYRACLTDAPTPPATVVSDFRRSGL